MEHEGKVLLCKRAIEPCRGKWTVPAGYLELDESTAGGLTISIWFHMVYGFNMVSTAGGRVHEGFVKLLFIVCLLACVRRAVARAMPAEVAAGGRPIARHCLKSGLHPGAGRCRCQ